MNASANPYSDPRYADATRLGDVTRPSPIQNGGKAILLIALGLFLYSRLTGGTLAFYINERFFAYTLFAFVGLIAVGLSYPLVRSKRRAAAASNATAAEADPTAAAPSVIPSSVTPSSIDYQYHDLAPHDHSRDHRLSLLGALVIALPIVLGILVPPRPLGAAALETREINLDVRGSRANLPAAVAAAVENDGPRNILDWWRRFQNTPDLTTLAGDPVNVQGFVYHDPQYGDDYFMVTRFVVSCCTADASAVALLVHWPQAATLENDAWIEVRGVFAATDVENNMEDNVGSWEPPVLQAESITPVEIPSHPYLYP